MQPDIMEAKDLTMKLFAKMLSINHGLLGMEGERPCDDYLAQCLENGWNLAILIEERLPGIPDIKDMTFSWA